MTGSGDEFVMDEIQRLPKVELHVHLDCCLSFSAVSRLMPGLDPVTYERRYTAPDRCLNLADFLTRVDNSLDLLQTADGLRLAVTDLFEQFRQDHIIYAEIRFAPLLHLRQGLSPAAVVGTVAGEVARNIIRTGIEARIILCTLRHFTAAESLATAELAVRFAGDGVAALDLAADEAGFPLAPHVPAFRFARERGVHCTAHAGEACGPESVRETLVSLRPARIGHGVRSVDDPVLTRELADRGIHLEICPSSNLQTGMYASLAAHPVERLRQSGVSLSISTDSRTLTRITLSTEYRRLREVFGWDAGQFYQCNRQALAAAFLDNSGRQALMRRLTAGYPAGARQDVTV